MRIEVGYGLESALTDAISSSILRDVVAPRFREGHIADGISAGLDAIDQAIAGTYKAPARRPAAKGPQINLFGLVLLLIVIGGLGMVILPALFAAQGARRNGWTGGRSGWGGPFIGGPYVGGGGFSGGGGSEGGGFSGGGGSFGGGGASGEW